MIVGGIMRFVSKVVLAGFASLFTASGGSAFAQTCSPSSWPYALANGNVADAGQVTADLNCPVYGLAHFNGDVGIGTTTPSGALHLSSTVAPSGGYAYGLIEQNGVSSAVTNEFRGLYVNPQLYAGSYTVNVGEGVRIGDFGKGSGANLTWDFGLYIDNITNGANNYAIYSAGGQNYFAGRMGLGTSTPNEQLVVDGDTLISNATGPTSIHFRTDGSNSYINNMNGFLSNGSAGNGYLIITGQSGIYFQYGSTGPSGSTGMLLTSSGSLDISNLAGAGNRAVYSDANGNLTNSSSDARMKTNITSLHDGLRAGARICNPNTGRRGRSACWRRRCRRWSLKSSAQITTAPCRWTTPSSSLCWRARSSNSRRKSRRRMRK